ncbi:MAG: ABC transporter substrate-binding protein [Bacteroidales bacterium]|nr:ABC transporter substrate-binding protein [Bacteroidales bacterium]
MSPNIPFSCSNVMNCQPKFIFLQLFLVALLLSSCHEKKQSAGIAKLFDRLADTEVVSEVDFAQGFDIYKAGGIAKLVIYKPQSNGDVLSTYFLVNRQTAEKYGASEGFVIVPLDSVAVFSGTQLNAMKNLGLLQKVVGVSEAAYILDQDIRERLADGRVTELAGNGNFYVERTLRLNPSVIFHSPYQANETNPLTATKIPMIPFFDFMENDPLGRAEWLKFTGLFFAKEAEAESQFNQIVAQYNYYKQIAAKVQQRPTVFSDKYFSGQWYVPGGQSYIAALFRDAGADYIWKDDTHNASFPLDYETVFSLAYDADYWRIVGSFGDEASYEFLIKEKPLYGHFKAFRKRRIIWCDAQETAYFEKSPLEPQRVLADFIKAFHPQLLPDYEPEYYFILP